MDQSQNKEQAEDKHPATEQESTSDKAPKKLSRGRRWLKRLSWLVIILGILGYLVNGPIARKLVHYFLNQSLEAQGMTGSVEIRGTILGGLQAHQLSYSGELGIQKLRVDQTLIDYQIMKLIEGKVDSVVLDTVVAQIDIAKFPAKEEVDEEETDWKQTLRTLRPYILQPNISIKNLDITVLNNGAKLGNWKLGELKHDTQSERFQLKQWVATNGEELTTPVQDATIIWQQNGVSMDRLEAIPKLALSDIQLDWESDLRGQSTIQFHETFIEAQINEITTLKLVRGKIQSADIFATMKSFGIEKPKEDAQLTIDALKITLPTADLEKPIPSWSLKGLLSIESGQWDGYQLEDTTLTLQQNNAHYHLSINGAAMTAPIQLNAKGRWTKPTDETWWDDTEVSLTYDAKATAKILESLPDTVVIPKEIVLANSQVNGELTTTLADGQLSATRGQLELKGITIDTQSVPTLLLDTTWEKEKTDTLDFTLRTKKSADGVAFDIKGSFNVKTEQYTGAITALTTAEQSPWIYALTKIFDSPASLANKLELQWTGSGNLQQKIHSGEMNTLNLGLKQEGQPPVTLNLNGSYDWPKSVDIAQISAEQEELYAQASLTWDSKEILIRDSKIKRNDELIGIIKGKLPYTRDITSAKDYFAQERPWDLTIDTEKLSLERLASLIPSEDIAGIKGSVITKLKLSGSPKNPAIDGMIDLNGINDIFELGLGEIDIDATFNTENEFLKVKGSVLENAEKRIGLNMELPFTPHQWLEDDNFLETIQKNSELKGTAEIKKLPLAKFKKLVPDLDKLEGYLDATAEFKGTIADPKYTLKFKAELPIISLKNAGLDDIKEASIEGELDESMIAKGELKAKINGGKFLSKFNIDVTNPDNPVFDINLETDHALVYRDDMFASRANANLTLKGTLEDAELSGDIGIVESLFYKDIDLIPIGVPSSAVGAVTLPSLDTKASKKLPIPAPFGQWKLNVTIKTTDPILLRGNIGNGYLQGTIKARGTLAEPSLDGTLLAKDVKAKLPFSVLSVNNGKIIFRPNRGLIPNLEIKGKSQVGVHNVNLYVYGAADNPKIVLSSLPALPENEIMTLLATGATNAGLANRDVATFKTLQVLLLKLKQKHDRPSGNKLFRRILSGIDDLDLKVGELNELTGEKYASATVELHERWFLTAQIDNNQPPQTRGLLVFALRFR